MKRWERDGRARPRLTYSNPRALGTNPRARAAGTGGDRDARRYRHALAVWKARLSNGNPLCHACDDTGWVDTGAGYTRCTDHRTLTAQEVATLLS